MNHTIAIFKKQLKDTRKNETVLIQFVMFPVVAFFMTQVIHIEGMADNFFVNMFAAMYIGMAPLTSIASVIAEEKEKNTLRMLFMSNVKPQEYLLGVGGFIWICCMVGSLAMGLTGGYRGRALLAFLAAMALGILTSLLIGAAIGTWSKNQMIATSVTVPVMMVFSFLPMFAMFNDTIAKIARVTYSQQISLILDQLQSYSLSPESIAVIALNVTAAAACFAFAYKKCGLA